MTQSFYLYDISDGAAARISLAFNCILTTGFGIIGVLGNILNIIILPQHGFKESSNIILISLSFSDLLVSLVLCLNKSYFIVDLYDHMTSLTMFAIYFVYFAYILQVTIVMGILHITLISIERFVAVWFPFHASRIFTARNVFVVIFLLYLINIVGYFPGNFFYYIKWLKYKNGNSTYAVVYYLPFYLKNADILNYYTFIFGNLIYIPLILLVVFTALIILKLIKAREKVKRMTQAAPDSMKSRDKKVFRLLLTVCIVAISVYISTSGLEIYLWMTAEGLAQTRKFRDVLVAVDYLLYQIGASVNFFIYVTMSSKFAKSYRKLILRNKSDKKI
ncbi:lysophosphatidic acid receptor 6-like [Physella acuta]|uniref:lysophosphatidic acid receptor 6-like n=1 Tax=Physella acuta TaxID=109671 RepID=UPI0027DDC59C|nr:lysophosphatidic acid receptor 6-like [Physella acuta]